MVFRREATYAIVAILVTLLVAATLFVYPAWSQQGQQGQQGQQEERRSSQTRERNSQQQQEERRSAQTGKRVSEEQRNKIDALSQQQAENELVQAAQTSNASGDLAGEPAEGISTKVPDNTIELITIDGADCVVDNNATITFEDGDGEVGVVVNNENVDINANGEITIEDNPDAPADGPEIEFFGDQLEPGDLEILGSTGIDCNGDNNDGFDDELLALLLLALLEDNINDFNQPPFPPGFNDPNDFVDEDDDGIPDFFDDDIDEDNDGDIDQEDEFLDAQNDLEDGEFTDGDDFDDDGPVSATAEDGQAEASTPGAVARSGGDPDELEPLTSIPDDVVNEIPTSGPLPNTGGMPMVYWLLPLAGLLMLAGLPVYRWAKRRG